MRRLRWRTLRSPDPEHRYLVSAGVFEVDRARNVPAFLRHAARVRRALHRTDGLVGYTLHARFRTRTFTELAAFESPGALRRFVGLPEHTDAIRAMAPHIGPRSKLVTLELYGRDLPPRPELVTARLEAIPGIGDAGEPERDTVEGAGSDFAARADAGAAGAARPAAG